ncbi:Na+/H+ antiporter [Jatrophihabitans telluris]|uniref:Na+/H+ antiporter n=1 Tax=Jatrophihabitans telluris TaxID=2038343 RepID=A0ABY4QV22_9ACTN|nr:Na+/H+ antiporter [Jatrophihabitans telluris]UQX87148.1 Na+/H+ antiporter [Jatrophihabitans telluris]
MHLATGLVLLVASAAVIAIIARRFELSEPLVLTAAGILGSYLPFIPDVHLTSQLVLVGLLPPLLYTTAIRSSLVDFEANRRAIGLLSVGLVLFTTFGVAVVTWLVLPVPFAAAVALGAVVAPPDAVAASAVAQRVGMPRRIITILEGESLLNDATALVALRTALAALAGSVSIWQAGGEFLWAAGGGVLVGGLVAMGLGLIRQRFTDPVLDTTVSFLAPFAAYLPAEQVHASGVLAVVVAGLILGHRAPVWQSAASRVAERTNWRTVDFVLESSVFLLIGLQVRTIVQDAWHTGLRHDQIVLSCLAVLGAVIVLRLVWMFPASYLPHLVPAVRRTQSPPSPQQVLVVGWAGMRGVVTLAAAFVLPTENNPYRDVLVLAAFVVTAGTLLVQGTTLPMLVRLLHLRGPSRAEDALQMAGLLQQSADAGLKRLDEIAARADPPINPDLIEQVRVRLLQRTNAAWERLGPTSSDHMTPSEKYAKLRLKVLNAERAEVLRVRDTGVLDHEILQTVMSMLDLEESTIDRLSEAEEDAREDQLIPTHVTQACEHLEQAPITHRPDTPGECHECVEEGLNWVHLRMCLTCGHVACCDSSPGLHADKHYGTTNHPVMRSVEPGEAWRWCYVDSLLG